MYYDEEQGLGGFLTGLLVGALLGVGVALLAAPDRGTITRQRLVRALRPGREGRGGAVDDELRALGRRGRRRTGR